MYTDDVDPGHSSGSESGDDYDGPAAGGSGSRGATSMISNLSILDGGAADADRLV
jgi:hypothetical protein